MNKDDLIGKIATNIGISKTDATKSVNAVFSNKDLILLLISLIGFLILQ